MAVSFLDRKNIELINVVLFSEEIGVLGYNKKTAQSYFAFNQEFLAKNIYKNIFPIGIKRINQVQLFKNQNTKTFRGLPSVFADSLPDDFGNTIFQKWLEIHKIKINDLTPIHQLAYVSNRGMGALEYVPGKVLDSSENIDLKDITNIVKEIISEKKSFSENIINNNSLFNVFKLGTSAGGARPKVIISEHRKTKKIIPGDIDFSKNYKHYLVKLNIEGRDSYNREKVEFAYSKMAKKAGIDMMPCKLIEEVHFATERYDRVNGKKHVLTATGISGLDYTNSEHSSYENLFEIANYINVPQRDLEEMFRRMVFNFVFHNTDDHLKNHSFIYNKEYDNWEITPGYDINYSLDALNKWVGAVHSLSLNNKRKEIEIEDFLSIAKKYAINRPLDIIEQVEIATKSWREISYSIGVPNQVIDNIQKDFQFFIHSN